MIGPYAVAGVAAQATVQHHDRLLMIVDYLIHLIDAKKARIDDDRIAAHIEQILNRLALLLRAVFAVGRGSAAAP